MGNEMRNSHKSVSTNVILMLFFVLFLMLFVGKMDVHAGASISIGVYEGKYTDTTVEDTDIGASVTLPGVAHVLLADDNVLYIFRTTDKGLQAGDAYTYTKDGKSYTGTIYRYREGSTYAAEPDGAFDVVIDGTIEKIVFLDDVAVYEFAIKGGANLKAIEGIGEHLNTKCVTDMSGAFKYLSALTSLDLSGLDTSNVTNMTDVFYGCTNLTSLNLSGIDTSNVTAMSDMFHDCSSLTSLDVSGLNTSNVTAMNGMFYGCSGLTSLDISKFKTGKVTHMNYMFYKCSALKSVNMSGVDTSSVLYMDHMFYECASLTDVDVSGFNTSKVTQMNYMFYKCSSLPYLNVSGFDTNNVTLMDHMFAYCSELDNLDVSQFKTGKVTSMSSMFADCSSLTSLDVSKFDTSNVTFMDWMFTACSKLTTLDVSHFDTSKVTTAYVMFSNCSGLTSLDVSEFKTGNMTEMGGMFTACSKLKTLDVSKFDLSKNESTWAMFSNCTSLTSLDVSGFDTKNVTNMEYMFTACNNLKVIDVSNFDTGKVKNMHAMFSNCTSVKLLDLSNFKTTNVTNAAQLFNNCSQLETLRINQFSVSRIPNIADMFSGVSSLTTLELGENAYFQTLPLPASSKTGYTHKWTLSDPYNHTDAVYASVLAKKTQGTGGAPGVWVAEKPGKDPSAQIYTTIATNIYDFAEHLDEDGNVKEGEDPVSLYRGDEGGGYWQKLSDGRWAYTFFVYKNDEVTWHIWEDPVVGYTGNYTITNTLDVTGSDIQAGVQPTITNTSTKAPKSYGTLTLTKKVIDENGTVYTTDKSFSFTVTLSGDNISGAQVFGDTAFLNGVAKVQLQGDESISFSDIPAGTSYSIQEDAADGYTSSFDSASGTITGNTEKTVICTNTKKTEQKDYVSFTVKKTVTSNADESSTVFDFHVSFTGLEINTTYSLSDGTTFASDTDGAGNVDFSLKKDQTVTVQNIPVGTKYIVTEDGGEYTSSYKVTDSNGVGKIVSATGNSTQTNAVLSTLTETADKGEDVLVTFTNKIVRTQNLVITKLSYLADGTADANDTSQYLVDITLSGLTAGQKIKTSSGMLIADDNGMVESSMYISPNEKLTLFDVPVGVTYKLSEQANNKIASYAISNTKAVVSASGKNTVSDKALSTAEEIVDAGEEATVTFTNTTPKSAKLQIIKYDNSGNKQKLGGAEFALYKSDGTAVNFTKDGTNIIKINDNGSSDVIDSSLFVAGSYYLQETKAPDSYMMSEPKSFTISASDAGKTLQIEVYDDKLVVLPVTGGKGRDKYISLTCILMAMSISLVVYKKRRSTTTR